MPCEEGCVWFPFCHDRKFPKVSPPCGTVSQLHLFPLSMTQSQGVSLKQCESRLMEGGREEGRMGFCYWLRRRNSRTTVQWRPAQGSGTEKGLGKPRECPRNLGNDRATWGRAWLAQQTHATGCAREGAKSMGGTWKCQPVARERWQKERITPGQKAKLGSLLAKQPKVDSFSKSGGTAILHRWQTHAFIAPCLSCRWIIHWLKLENQFLTFSPQRAHF